MLALGVHGILRIEQRAQRFALLHQGPFCARCSSKCVCQTFFFDHLCILEPVCQSNVWFSAETYLPLQPRVLT